MALEVETDEWSVTDDNTVTFAHPTGKEGNTDCKRSIGCTSICRKLALTDTISGLPGFYHNIVATASARYTEFTTMLWINSNYIIIIEFKATSQLWMVVYYMIYQYARPDKAEILACQKLIFAVRKVWFI